MGRCSLGGGRRLESGQTLANSRFAPGDGWSSIWGTNQIATLMPNGDGECDENCIVDYEVNIPATTDKLTIFGDAIRVLNQLEFESQKSKEMNEKLPKEIKTLKWSNTLDNLGEEMEADHRESSAAVRRARISAKKEAPVNFLTDPSDGRSRRRCFDFWMGLRETCAALKAATSKVTEHEKTCIENQHVFILFAFDTFGFLVLEAVKPLNRIQRVRTHLQLQFLKQYQWNVQYVLKGCKEIDYMVLVLSDSLLGQGNFGYHLDEWLVSHKVGLLDLFFLEK
ncbi:hypothetical protein Tco_1406437 [Tanacetum coccineum]